jgi:hypothetical protein
MSFRTRVGIKVPVYPGPGFAVDRSEAWMNNQHPKGGRFPRMGPGNRVGREPRLLSRPRGCPGQRGSNCRNSSAALGAASSNSPATLEMPYVPGSRWRIVVARHVTESAHLRPLMEEVVPGAEPGQRSGLYRFGPGG